MTRAIITLPLVSDPDDRQYVTLFSADVKGVHIHKADALWSNVEVRIPSIKVHVEDVDIPQYMYYSIDYPYRELREMFERYWLQEASQPGKHDGKIMTLYHGGGWQSMKEQKKEE